MQKPTMLKKEAAKQAELDKLKAEEEAKKAAEEAAKAAEQSERKQSDKICCGVSRCRGTDRAGGGRRFLFLHPAEAQETGRKRSC